MSILFEVNTATLVAGEAHALAGFLDALFPGRNAAPATVLTVDAAPAPLPPVPAPAPAPAPAGHDLAEKLIAGEAARVAGLGLVAPAAGEGTTYPVKLPNGTEVDVEGLPWDARIHTGAKSLLKGGAWKLQRNVAEDLVAQVKNELRQVMSAPPAVPVAVAPPAPAPLVPPAPTPAPAPVIQVEGSAPPAAVAPETFAAATFADLMSRVVDLSVAGTPVATVNAICAELGLTQPRDANLRPDLIPALMAKLAAL